MAYNYDIPVANRGHLEDMRWAIKLLRAAGAEQVVIRHYGLAHGNASWLTHASVDAAGQPVELELSLSDQLRLERFLTLVMQGHQGVGYFSVRLGEMVVREQLRWDNAGHLKRTALGAQQRTYGLLPRDQGLFPPFEVEEEEGQGGW